MVMELVADSQRLVALDLVEVNPDARHPQHDGRVRRRSSRCRHWANEFCKVGPVLGASVPRPTLTGTTIGAYRILSLLGAGGMGEVYTARDQQLERDVAIKVLPEAFAHDQLRIDRFRREAQLLAALNHPNIATIHGLEDDDGALYLVMELVPGQTLAERLHSGRLPLDETLRVCRSARRSARCRTSARHRASRHQASQHQADARRQGQDPGLRPGEVGRRRERSSSAWTMHPRWR